MRRNREEPEELKAARAKWEAQSKEEKDEARRLIDEKTSAAMKLIEEATKVADESGVFFYFDITHGMGGCYDPYTKWGSQYDDGQDGWLPSSKSC